MPALSASWFFVMPSSSNSLKTLVKKIWLYTVALAPREVQILAAKFLVAWGLRQRHGLH